MSKKLIRLRSELSINVRTNEEDIALILKNINRNDPEVITNAYFVIAAKSNNQSSKTVLNLFIASFENSNNKTERYKLVAKLENHNLLINETVTGCLLQSNIPKDWEVYLGLILSNSLQNEFKELWNQSESNPKLTSMIEMADREDWNQVTKLLELILANRTFTPGDV